MAVSGVMTAADWRAMCGDLDELLAHERPFAALLDAREAKLPDFDDLRDCAVFLRERKRRFRRWHRGVASVTSSPLIRGVLEGVAQLGALPMPIASFEAIEPARDWLVGRLGAGSERDVVLDHRVDVVRPSR
ncbi:STAS/SEC14 domain-containing protein [Nannocystaceae bacterium ST9]